MKPNAAALLLAAAETAIEMCGGPKRTGTLYRHVDTTGISGTGHVAALTETTAGPVVIVWAPTATDGHAGISIQPSQRAVIDVHGHNGCTRILWDKGIPQ